MSDNSEWENAMIERRIAEMSDDDFRSLVSRTRPPEVPKPNHAPNVGQQPSQSSETEHLAALEAEGRWGEAGQVKAQQLSKLITEQSRGW